MYAQLHSWDRTPPRTIKCPPTRTKAGINVTTVMEEFYDKGKDWFHGPVDRENVSKVSGGSSCSLFQDTMIQYYPPRTVSPTVPYIPVSPDRMILETVPLQCLFYSIKHDVFTNSFNVSPYHRLTALLPSAFCLYWHVFTLQMWL